MAAPTMTKTTPSVPEFGDEPQMVRVKFLNTDAPDGKEDVTIGVNGKVWQIKRQVPVDIPEFVLRTADNCIMTIPDPNNEEAPIREVMRFPYIRV